MNKTHIMKNFNLLTFHCKNLTKSCHSESERSEDIVIPCKSCKVLLLRNFSSVEQIQDSECAAIQKNSYKNDWIASSDLCPPRNNGKLNKHKELFHYSQLTHYPLSPTPSPAGRGEKKAASTLAEGPRRTGYNATIFGNTPRLSRSAGFTLAEVLITIGIIGVVAALTTPSLINNYHKRQYYTQFMKARSILENAKLAYDDEDGSVHDYDGVYSYFSPLIESMAKHNKGELIKDLSKITSYEIKALNGEIDYYEEGFSQDCTNSPDIIFETMDGIDFIHCSAFNGDSVMIDINGYRNKPNTYGRDIFYINEIDPEESTNLIWLGSNGTWKDGCSNPKEDDGFTCAGRLLEKGKMDY
ncbi:type II secretion system protein [bacterium]|nr:type II secretion system protein [bacterium]